MLNLTSKMYISNFHFFNRGPLPIVQVEVHQNNGISSIGYYDPSYVLQSTTITVPNARSVVYKLVGIVVHQQLSSGLGHYVTFFRSAADHMKWFYANDQKVHIPSAKTYRSTYSH